MEAYIHVHPVHQMKMFPRHGFSAHSNPAFKIHPHLPTFLNIFPKSHCPSLSLSAFVATYFANSCVSKFFFSPCVVTQTSFSLFFPHFILPSLFSPSDPAQMASRCCSSSFAFTNISSAHTAKKTLEEMFTVFGKEAGKRVVEDSFVMD